MYWPIVKSLVIYASSDDLRCSANTLPLALISPEAVICESTNIDNEEDKEKAIDGFITYLATEKLGDEVLKVLDSPMGSVENHEGVVIRDENIASVPFKITGKFILGGMATSFTR